MKIYHGAMGVIWVSAGGFVTCAGVIEHSVDMRTIGILMFAIGWLRIYIAILLNKLDQAMGRK